ncbi:hypothetical protein GCM10007891_19570 [Methylophaga thalassica]|uniref:Uncharacterized protein n=1 Tax=Methylophaga thalassica TaxID=40223 RepID=A0ABQ5TWG4_9GAMM|nr:hypothetical protein [Methylophaga thalassica]GLQ00104.1 hypothetical protein GCM10007891_19570 [Methylophaga thalassica]
MEMKQSNECDWTSCKYEVFSFDNQVFDKKQIVAYLTKNYQETRSKELDIHPHILEFRSKEMEAIGKMVNETISSLSPKYLTAIEFDEALADPSNFGLPKNVPIYKLQAQLASKQKFTKATHPDNRDESVLDETTAITSKSAETLPETKESTDDTKDDSYDNAYGLINYDVQDYMAKLFQPALNSETTEAGAIASINEWDVDCCRRRLEKISSTNYGESERKEFFMINYRLSCLGVAPRWRGMIRDSHYWRNKKTVTPAQTSYLQDTQIFDLEWLHRRYREHRVDTSWNGVFEGIFSTEKFDTKKATLIAGMSMTPEKKVRYLMLTPDMQKELFMLRTKKTEAFIKGLIEKSLQVRLDLLTAARRNRRRGKRMTDNLQRREDLWIASNLIPGSSLNMIIDNYEMMTGERLKPSNCQRIQKSINAALSEVGSKYVHS